MAGSGGSKLVICVAPASHSHELGPRSVTLRLACARLTPTRSIPPETDTAWRGSKTYCSATPSG
jgi:hypothetical protein